ncbi:solute carrier family 22 member 4-like isoform X2 [Boleophthalmus pectinirostris]|uniref:solute carrier family 22 member 4-like isoform X2 n=1 Tax=Boleophthalmus pectinirostris TaxID=150288 RepID=UPI00242B3FC2|nr:solute carrier family 22 member 4-like isoform X2 [Boleophthalmus pectinirostris]
MKDYEECIAFLGQWGCFQFVIFFLLCASIMPNGFGAFTLVFLTDVPPHHCIVPGANLTEEWQKAAIPIEVVNGVEEKSRCSRYRLDVVMDLWAQGSAPGDVNLTQLQQEPCVDGWSYSKDIYQSTLVTEFDLVCHDEWKQPFTASVFYAGVTCGSLFSGELSDKFGRKPILFATMAVQTLFTFFQVFADSWILFTVLLFFNGLGQMSNFVAALVLGAEILTGHARVMYSSLATNSAFALGYMMLPLFAYFLRDWRGLLLGLAVPGLAYIPMWWLIPESPRWLLFQGKVKEAEAIIKKAARWNKIPVPQNTFDQFVVPEKEQEKAKKNYSVLDLFKTSTIRITTLNLFFIWFIMFLAYYGLNLNTSQLHPNPYLSCFISALVEIPAYTCSWLILSSLKSVQPKNGSEVPYDELHTEASYVARIGVTGASPWSQSWGGCSPASAWWPGLPPRGPAALSPKERRGAVLTWAHVGGSKWGRCKEICAAVEGGDLDDRISGHGD